MSRKTHIVIHCTATAEGRDVKASELDAWHKAKNFEPWENPATNKLVFAGYHYLVHIDGSTEQLRDPEARGQHCPQQNMNNAGISIVYAGGIDKTGKPKDTRTTAQKSAILELIRRIRSKFGNLQVIGHKDVKGVAKACPSFDAKTEYQFI